MLLLLLSPPRRGATLRFESAPVLTDSSQHLIATVRITHRIDARPHIRVMLGGYNIVVVEKEGEIIAVAPVKFRALELSKFIVHHALFEEVVINLTHILYRFVGRPRRGRTDLLGRGRPR